MLSKYMIDTYEAYDKASITYKTHKQTSRYRKAQDITRPIRMCISVDGPYDRVMP